MELLSTGIFSPMPNTPWASWLLGHWGDSELRSVVLVTYDDPPNGPIILCISANRPCVLDVYLCRRSLDLLKDSPTWSEYGPGSCKAWQEPGGLGNRDAEFVSTRGLSPGRKLPLILNDKRRFQSYLIIRRVDTGLDVVSFEIAVDSPVEPQSGLRDGPASSRMVRGRGSVSAGPDPRHSLDLHGSSYEGKGIDDGKK